MPTESHAKITTEFPGADPTLDPVAALERELEALERALKSWDLAGIAAHETGARLAVERVRLAGLPATGAVRGLMELTARCMRLTNQGAELTGTLRRAGTLTYAVPGADTGIRWNSQAAGEGVTTRLPVATEAGGEPTER